MVSYKHTSCHALVGPETILAFKPEAIGGNQNSRWCSLPLLLVIPLIWEKHLPKLAFLRTIIAPCDGNKKSGFEWQGFTCRAFRSGLQAGSFQVPHEITGSFPSAMLLNQTSCGSKWEQNNMVCYRSTTVGMILQGDQLYQIDGRLDGFFIVVAATYCYLGSVMVRSLFHKIDHEIYMFPSLLLYLSSLRYNIWICQTQSPRPLYMVFDMHSSTLKNSFMNL